jgi:hypothetical protein
MTALMPGPSLTGSLATIGWCITIRCMPVILRFSWSFLPRIDTPAEGAWRIAAFWRCSSGWTAPSFLEAVTSGKVGTRDITEAAPR